MVPYRNIPQNLEEKIRVYYTYQWMQRAGYSNEGMLSDLPESLQKQLSAVFKQNAIEKVDVFRNLSKRDLQKIGQEMQSTTLMPGEFAFKTGEEPTRVFFLIRGTISLHKAGKEKNLALRREGSFFGEMALADQRAHDLSAKATTYCDLYYLPKDNFNQMLANFPEIADAIRRKVEERNHHNASVWPTFDE